MIDTLNLAVRQLVRLALDMPDNSVRPAEQSAPAGGQTAEYATVKIISCEGLGWANRSIEDDGHGGSVEVVGLPEQFVASVNFYGSSTKDAVGKARYSNEAFDRAARLERVLQLSGNVDRMTTIGMLLVKASAPRNLAALVDATWQSRGQVDLTFTCMAREESAITTALSATFTISTLTPTGVVQTRTTEVTS